MRKWKKEAKFEIQMHKQRRRTKGHLSTQVCVCMYVMCVCAYTVPSYSHSNQSTMCWLISQMEVGIFSIFTLQTWFCHHGSEKREQTPIHFLKCRKLKQHKSFHATMQSNQYTISNPLFSRKEPKIFLSASQINYGTPFEIYSMFAGIIQILSILQAFGLSEILFSISLLDHVFHWI